MDRVLKKKKWTLRKITIIVFVLAFAVFMLYNFIFADFSSKLNVDKDRLLISIVKKEHFQEYIPVNGTVEPIQTFFLDISNGGKIVEKYVDEGAMLNFGDPIVRLDNPNLSLQVMSTQSSFLQAESYARQTRLTFEQNLLNKKDQLLNVNLNLFEQERKYRNNKILFEKGLISKDEYESSKEKFETILKSKKLLKEVLKNDSLTFLQIIKQSQINADMSKKYLDLVEDQLENLLIKAPIKGQLTFFNAEIGQSVNPGFRIGQIDNIDSFKVKVEIDEYYLTRVSVGQLASFDFNNEEFKMKIKTIYPQIVNGKFSIDMIFDSKQPIGIRIGQTVRMKLQLGNLSEELVIDRGSFYQETGGEWIYVLNESENIATKRKITLGRQNTRKYEVIDGLVENEKVIVSSYENYGDTEKLIIK